MLAWYWQQDRIIVPSGNRLAFSCQWKAILVEAWQNLSCVLWEWREEICRNTFSLHPPSTFDNLKTQFASPCFVLRKCKKIFWKYGGQVCVAYGEKINVKFPISAVIHNLCHIFYHGTQLSSVVHSCQKCQVWYTGSSMVHSFVLDCDWTWKNVNKQTTANRRSHYFRVWQSP